MRQFILENVSEHPSDIGRFTAQTFSVSRQSIGKHLSAMVKSGLLAGTGRTKAREYRLKVLAFNKSTMEVLPHLEEDIVWRETILPWVDNVKTNVLDICQFGFTEMFNNVLEHSDSQIVTISVERDALNIRMRVIDEGIGIFNKIQAGFKLNDPRDAILELAKGKLSTSEEAHSGEGIFFASRMFDQFNILSGSLFFGRANTRDDAWLIERDSHNDTNGTAIYMDINLFSDRTTKDVFDKYTSEFDDYAFTRTHVPIKLARYGNEQLVSRSQAKRVLARFDRFKEILLDFEGIETIGPAFADEIFRVFKSRNPTIELVALYKTPAVDQMIQRAEAARSQ